MRELHQVLVERGVNYADFRDNSVVFNNIMSAVGVQVPDGMHPTDQHAISMIATKLSRYSTGSREHEDTWIDIANYAILALADLRRRKGVSLPEG